MVSYVVIVIFKFKLNYEYPNYKQKILFLQFTMRILNRLNF